MKFNTTVDQCLHEGYSNILPETKEPFIDVSNTLFQHGNNTPNLRKLIMGNPTKFEHLSYGPGIYITENANVNNQGYGKYHYHVTLNPSTRMLNGNFRADVDDLEETFANSTGRFKKYLIDCTSRYTYPSGIRLHAFLREAVQKKINLRETGWDGVAEKGLEVVLFNDKCIQSVKPIS